LVIFTNTEGYVLICR